MALIRATSGKAVRLNSNGAKVLSLIQVTDFEPYFKVTRLSSEIAQRTYSFLGRERKISRMAILGSCPICAAVMRLRGTHGQTI